MVLVESTIRLYHPITVEVIGDDLKYVWSISQDFSSVIVLNSVPQYEVPGYIGVDMALTHIPTYWRVIYETTIL